MGWKNKPQKQKKRPTMVPCHMEVPKTRLSKPQQPEHPFLIHLIPSDLKGARHGSEAQLGLRGRKTVGHRPGSDKDLGPRDKAAAGFKLGTPK